MNVPIRALWCKHERKDYRTEKRTLRPVEIFRNLDPVLAFLRLFSGTA